MQFPPHVPVVAPLRRKTHRPPRRPSGAALGIAAGVHALALLALVAGSRSGSAKGGAAPGSRRAEAVAYVEVGAWPGTGQAPAAQEASPASSTDTPRAAPAAQPDTGSRGATVPAIARTPVEGTAGQTGGAAVADTGGASATPRPRARSPLGAELGDPRLVVPRQRASASPPPAAYFADFHRALRAFNDSVMDRADRDRRAASWTWTDPEGRAWGVRQGVLVINGVQVMNVEMYGERDQERTAGRISRQGREAAAQSDRIERERAVQERGRATRARRDRERAAGAP
ncbi:MAG TPA: hypothetical protein VF665_13700 [Longimicrobium sp.]|jgi:hypothetical protein|uniref:hypothetical protein n=1 Tax=Longimicrobium sp. TaxID=2029185 RepID=UPI002ED80D83